MITHNKDIMGGRPCVRGTGVLISLILEELSEGWDMYNVTKANGLHIGDVIAAIEWASTKIDTMRKE